MHEAFAFQFSFFDFRTLSKIITYLMMSVISVANAASVVVLNCFSAAAEAAYYDYEYEDYRWNAVSRLSSFFISYIYIYCK